MKLHNNNEKQKIRKRTRNKQNKRRKEETKPIKRNEAQRLLDNFDNLKWDHTFKRVANSLGIQLR